MRPTQHPKVASVDAGLSRAEPQEAQRELWRRGREEFRLDSQFATRSTRLVIQAQSINWRQMSIKETVADVARCVVVLQVAAEIIEDTNEVAIKIGGHKLATGLSICG
jgi:hypothetical protein